MAIDKDKLLARRLATEIVVIPDVGEVVIRALTRAEATTFANQELDVTFMERQLLVMALVDPVLSMDEVDEWRENSSAGELQPIIEAITRLSGMEAESPKVAVKEFRGEPGPGVHVLPSGSA